MLLGACSAPPHHGDGILPGPSPPSPPLCSALPGLSEPSGVESIRVAVSVTAGRAAGRPSCNPSASDGRRVGNPRARLSGGTARSSMQGLPPGFPAARSDLTTPIGPGWLYDTFQVDITILNALQESASAVKAELINLYLGQ